MLYGNKDTAHCCRATRLLGAQWCNIPLTCFSCFFRRCGMANSAICWVLRCSRTSKSVSAVSASGAGTFRTRCKEPCPTGAARTLLTLIFLRSPFLLGWLIHRFDARSMSVCVPRCAFYGDWALLERAIPLPRIAQVSGRYYLRMIVLIASPYGRSCKVVDLCMAIYEKHNVAC